MFKDYESECNKNMYGAMSSLNESCNNLLKSYDNLRELQELLHEMHGDADFKDETIAMESIEKIAMESIEKIAMESIHDAMERIRAAIEMLQTTKDRVETNIRRLDKILEPPIDIVYASPEAMSHENGTTYFSTLG